MADEFPGPLYLWGESLGAGVAAAVAADKKLPIKGVVLLTPWDNLKNVAKYHHRFVPVGLFLRDRYDSVKNMEGFDRPVAVVMADRDVIIPNPLTMNLYRSLPANKRLFVLEGCGHNNWVYCVTEDWWREVTESIQVK
jgi:pimeloyl-ACP methyl ester carboxylesterase